MPRVLFFCLRFLEYLAMADVIATIWDFDKTLIPGYMQQPIFRKFRIDGRKDFWDVVNRRIKELVAEGYEVNADSYYLNTLIEFSGRGGAFEGLDNAELKELGAEIEFYPGAVELFETIKSLNDDDRFREYGISFENYIVSTGLKKLIQGSAIDPFVKRIWGAELIDAVEKDGFRHLGSIAYSLDNTTKTRALFEINKGVGIVEGASLDVNTKIPMEERRVQFFNMVYVADGPSDVPAFSVVNQKGGATLAVFQPGNPEAFEQADKLRREDRVQMIAEADYRKNTPAYMWLMKRLNDQAESIIREKQRIFQRPAGTPKHLA